MDQSKIGTVVHTIAMGSGKYFDYTDPQPEHLDIEDIAQALSNICRFNGHCNFYSVAEHSVHCANLAEDLSLPDAGIFAALMHDAHEAYIGDMPKPLKNIMPEYSLLENVIEEVVQKHFSASTAFKKVVKMFDLQMLKAEKAHLFPHDEENWFGFDKIKKVDITIQCWDPRKAMERFLLLFQRYQPLTCTCTFGTCDNKPVCKKLGMCRYKYHKDVING